MRASRLKLHAASIIATAVLAACGGGGGSSSSSDSSQGNSNAQSNGNGQTASAGAIALLPVAATAVTVPAASGNPSIDGTVFINAVRQTVGLPALTADPGLGTASLDHSTYLVDNDASGHAETQGLTGYTGADPFTRMEALGSYTEMGEVVVAGVPAAFSDSMDPVQLVFDAPFHRVIMLGDFKAMGVGSMQNASWEAFTVDFGNIGGAIPANTLVAYPYSGQTDAPPTWFANESPNPFATAPQYEGTTVGYPVTIEGNFTDTLSGVAFTITDANGANVSCMPQTPQTSGSELTNAAFCVPYAPLNANAKYTVHATGTLTSASTGSASAFDLTWSFKTGSVTSVMHSTGAIVNRPRPIL